MYADQIPGLCIALLQDDGEDPFARHHAVSCLLPDRAVRMTFLADLRDLAQRSADSELCPDREFVKLDPVAEDVFRKSAREERYADLLLQAIHALFAEQADLAVPVSRVGVSCMRS